MNIFIGVGTSVWKEDTGTSSQLINGISLCKHSDLAADQYLSSQNSPSQTGDRMPFMDSSDLTVMDIDSVGGIPATKRN